MMQSRSIRIFVSSTFRDFAAERDLLAKVVFPELRRRARTRAVDIVGVDLRWGITEAQSRRGQTLPICLREIDRSRPFFVGLLGDRYGWIPKADRFPAGLVRSQPWLREHLGGISITELEIRHGVLNRPGGGDGLFYFRRRRLPELRNQAPQPEPEHASVRLDALKSRIRSGGYKATDYTTPQELARLAVEDLWSRIDACFPADAIPDADSLGERMHHAFAEERRRAFVGRDEVTSHLTQQIDGALDNQRPLLVIGPSGSGKSSIVSNLPISLERRKPYWRIFEHYMGAGGESGSPRVEALLQRFRKWLRREYGVQPTAAAKAEELRDTFQTILEQAGRSAIERGERAILIVDALNKCNEVALREWLPAQLPAGVTLLGTTTPGKNADHLVREGALCCRLPGLTRRSARRIIVAELHRRGRALDREDIECILRHPQSGSPAFLHALIDELCLFGKHEGLKARLQSLLRSRHASGIYGQGLRRVEIDHGRACVSRTISALCLSSEGLTESQLLAFTGVSPAAWAGIRLAVGDCLHELDGRIRPAHDLFRQAAIRRFCHSARAQERLHRRIARWLRSEPIGPTEAFELVFHTYWSRSPAMARDILLNPSTGIPVVEHVSTTNIIRLATSATKSRGGTPSRWLNHTLTGAWRRWGLSHRRSERQQRQSRWSAGINLLDVLEHSGATSLGVMALARDVVRLARSLDRGSTPETARNLAISEQRVGILALRTGQSDLALRSLVASNALAQRLARGSTDGNELGDLASSLEVLADALRVAGDTRGERRATRRSLDVARKRQRLERSADGAHDLCVGLVRSAIRAMEDGNPKRAQPLLDEAVAVVQDARGRYGERRLRGAYASAIFNQARLMLQSHRPSAALPLLDEMIEISSQDLDDLSHVEDRAQLAAGLGAKAEALLRCGDTDEARAAAQLAIRIERELLMRGNSNESLREYCVSLEMLADIEQESGRPSAAFAALSSAIDALELAERDRPLPDELSTVLREDRHRAVELADGKPWSLKASRHLEALLSGARKVSSGDRSAAGSAFLLYYLMLGVRLRKLKSPSSRTERNEIRRMAGVVLSSWKSGAASRRANGITIDDKVLAEAALQFAES